MEWRQMFVRCVFKWCLYLRFGSGEKRSEYIWVDACLNPFIGYVVDKLFVTGLVCADLKYCCDLLIRSMRVSHNDHCQPIVGILHHMRVRWHILVPLNILISINIDIYAIRSVRTCNCRPIVKHKRILIYCLV